MIVLGIVWLAGCASSPPTAGQQVAAVTPEDAGLQTVTAVPPQPTASATPQPTATNTPTPTATPTATPTPTPTAVPILNQGNPRDVRLQAPVAQAGAACGIVDILDFPLDPPEAETVTRGGQDFGVFRDRYDSYHAGEDWWISRGEGNFGRPVYAIGHGTVTYAEPLGWGRDQGVVIVRHILADGRTFLSFYGHLDPPSITLRAGECVERGQKIGEIGRPRTPPHLHFEIRTHMPTEPGGGYWDVDPTQAGWLPPSQTIWEQRNTMAPGVIWSWPLTDEGSVPVGMVDDQTYLLVTDKDLRGVNLADGGERWRLTGEFAISQARVDAAHQRVLVASRQGDVVAYGLVQAGNGLLQPDSTPLWQQNLALVGRPSLIPLPDGGVLVSVRQRLFALAADGQLLWENELPDEPQDWVLAGGQLILASSGRNGGLWTVTADGLAPWPDAPNGRFLSHNNLLLLYADDGIYQLDPDAQTAVLWYPLPTTFSTSVGMVPLVDGGVLVLHSDSYDRRLLALNSDGSLRWERSLGRTMRGDLSLLTAGNRVYLLALNGQSANHTLDVYAVDVAQPALTYLFAGGTRLRGFNDTWTRSAGNVLLMQIGGGNLLALDVSLAETAVLSQ